MQKIVWANVLAAIWRPKQEILRPVRDIDKVFLEELIGIDKQKEAMANNASRFVSGRSFNHVLLWGARGTGKSSLIKAMLMHFKDEKLRIIEFAKEDLRDLPEVVDALRALPYYFIIFCDDMSFEPGDDSYKGLKPILEESIEAPPHNVMICATSNGRHLVSESILDNASTKVEDGELHYGDAAEEKISLADRFGLWISFYHGSQKDFLKMVDYYFKDFVGDKESLHQAAKEFAASRASRSGRTAKQFYNANSDTFLQKKN